MNRRQRTKWRHPSYAKLKKKKRTRRETPSDAVTLYKLEYRNVTPTFKRIPLNFNRHKKEFKEEYSSP